MTLLELIVAACLLWNSTTPFPIEVRNRDETSPDCWGAAACVTVTEDGTCVMWLGEGFYQRSELGVIALLAHEIGHCWGIMGDGTLFFGTYGESLMNGTPGVSIPNDYDMIMWRWSNFQYKTRVPMITTELIR